jgi:exopolyphosphatase/guanosine-5'-triphosphate,3'-diphosphate pyrophosphatase
MKRASIDIGSNTINLLVGTIENNNLVEHVHISRVTALGKGLINNNEFHPDSMKDSYRALGEYRELVIHEGIQPNEVVVTATEASRVAKNSKNFFKKIHNELGFNIQIITADGEAYYTAQGVCSSFSDCGCNGVIMDIGGGSTELIKVKEDPFEIVSSISLNIGSVKASDLAKTGELQNFIDEKMKEVRSENFKTKELISVAGTMTSIAAIDLNIQEYNRPKIQGHKVSLKRLEEIYFLLLEWGPEEILRLYPFLGKRSKVIAFGAKIAYSIGKKLGIETYEVSTYGLRYGTLYEGKIDGRFLAE